MPEQEVVCRYRLRYTGHGKRYTKIIARELERTIAELGWTKLRGGGERGDAYSVFVATDLDAGQIADTLAGCLAELPDIATVGEPVDRDTLRRDIEAAKARIKAANTTLQPGTEPVTKHGDWAT